MCLLGYPEGTPTGMDELLTREDAHASAICIQINVDSTFRDACLSQLKAVKSCQYLLAPFLLVGHEDAQSVDAQIIDNSLSFVAFVPNLSRGPRDKKACQVQ